MRLLYGWLQNTRAPMGTLLLNTEEEDFPKSLDTEYLKTIVNGATSEINKLEDVLSPYLDRSIESLSPIEHALLLIGTFEMSALRQTPYRVIINEAVELAKSYGGTDGYKFVNGVLDKLVITLRPNESDA